MIQEHRILVERLIVKVAGSIGEYIWAAENSDNPATSARFLNCANQREHGLKHLQDALRLLADDRDREPDDEITGDKRLATNRAFRDALSSGDQRRIEAQIRREEEEILGAFHAILKLDLDEKTEHEIHQSLDIIKQSSIQVPADE